MLQKFFEKSFKEQYSFDERKEIYDQMKKKMPTAILVIIQKNAKANLKNIEKKKFAIDRNTIVNDIYGILRNRIQLDPTESFYLFAKDESGRERLCNLHDTIQYIHSMYKNEDGFLYLYYQEMNTFGVKDTFY